RASGGGDHIGRARADRGRAGEGLQTVLHLRVRGGGVDHRLLVARLIVAERIRILLERLPDACDVTMPQDAPASGEERVFAPVPLAVAPVQGYDQRGRPRVAVGRSALQSSP